ncbi:hypothetical protein [Cupriavidus sp. 8B]
MTQTPPFPAAVDAVPHQSGALSAQSTLPLAANNVTGHPLMQPLRYAKEIQEIAICPPMAVQPLSTVGYRFVFQDLSNKRNFLPVALLQPDRILNDKQPITQCCSGYALSMFTSEENLAGKVRAAKKSAPMLLKRLGDHFVELAITAADGLCGEPSNTGHFDFFERVTFNATAAVRNHRRIDL